ncbi:alpha-ketoglutarate dehydrogenase component 4 isoform X1 [Chrysemys picta bellii]|uniref:alpha-ketoglutarate dehydrogenase component 4 isoform X1 n=1 Tax=Chrysemys picta bellii TaxID=8478 RepID=UPI0032B159B9
MQWLQPGSLQSCCRPTCGPCRGPTARLCVKVVKPHTPLIKFPDRKNSPKPKLQESLQARVPPLHASAAQMSVGDRPPALQNISSISRVQGTPDTTELVKTLPQKYRRKLMSDEEMEYIQRGGPE